MCIVVLAGSVAVLQGVSSTGTSLYYVDKDQGVWLTALTLSMRVERLAAPSQVLMTTAYYRSSRSNKQFDFVTSAIPVGWIMDDG